MPSPELFAGRTAQITTIKSQPPRHGLCVEIYGNTLLVGDATYYVDFLNVSSANDLDKADFKVLYEWSYRRGATLACVMDGTAGPFPELENLIRAGAQPRQTSELPQSTAPLKPIPETGE